VAFAAQPVIDYLKILPSLLVKNKQATFVQALLLDRPKNAVAQHRHTETITCFSLSGIRFQRSPNFLLTSPNCKPGYCEATCLRIFPDHNMYPVTFFFCYLKNADVTIDTVSLSVT